MNYADKMERESRLMGRLADWMETQGNRNCNSTAYCGDTKSVFVGIFSVQH